MSGHLPSTIHPSVRLLAVPAAGRRAGGRTDGGGLKAVLPQDGDLQINVKAAQGEGSSPAKKKKKSWPLFILHPWSRTDNYCTYRAPRYKKPLGMPGEGRELLGLLGGVKASGLWVGT